MDLIRTALLLSVLTPVPPLAKPAAEVLLPRTPLLSLAQELDLAQKRLAAFVQPIAQSPVCGSSSFAELSVYSPQKRPDAGHLMGRRMPELSGLDPRGSRCGAGRHRCFPQGKVNCGVERHG